VYDVTDPVVRVAVTIKWFGVVVVSTVAVIVGGPIGTPVAVELLLPDEVITVTVAVYVTPFVRPVKFAV
jgi:archaellum component FlaF (FlaF/FlaG flagellin family)